MKERSLKDTLLKAASGLVILSLSIDIVFELRAYHWNWGALVNVRYLGAIFLLLLTITLSLVARHRSETFKEKVRYANAFIYLLYGLLIIFYPDPPISRHIPAEQQEQLAYIKETSHMFKAEAADLNKMIEEGETVNVYIGQEDCQACRAFVKKLDQVLAEDTSKKVYYLETDSNDPDLHEFQKKYGFQAIPLLATFADGQLVRSVNLSGDISPAMIEQLLDTE